MKKLILVAMILNVGLYSCSPSGPDVIAIPVVYTTAIIGITSNTAQAGGIVTSDAGNVVLAKGICWSRRPVPFTRDSKTNDGSGTGNYGSTMTDLLPNTTYYIRAYATNSEGTAYGNELSFVTESKSETTVTDIDGNVYNIVTIGSQTWMKENLKTTRYNNGDDITTGLNEDLWRNTTSGAYSVYNNDPANDDRYGKLYNWYAAIDPRKIAPQGWHVPTLEEWKALIQAVGDYPLAGGALKESGFSHWHVPNAGATNSSDFIALPAGSRLDNGTYASLGDYGYWWTSTEYLPGSSDAEAILLLNRSPEALQVTGKMQNGSSIRCVKD